MGLWKRLVGGEDKPRSVRVAVVGNGPDHQPLQDAYAAVPVFEPASVCKQHSLELIRAHEVAALEICLPPAEAREVALAGLREGLFVSIPCPPDRAVLTELQTAATENFSPLSIRMLPLYYPPYVEMKRLLDDDVVGTPVMLKMTVRRGQGTVLPDPFDPAVWIRECEIGFLALAVWMMGPAVKASARLESRRVGAAPASAVIAWKFDGSHQYGYLQLDFCPDLHVRTFTDPVHRALELTGVGGVIFATRGEGQLLRQPPLIVRGKNSTTASELLTDDWREVYANIAKATAAALNDAQPVRATAALADQALQILELAGV